MDGYRNVVSCCAGCNFEKREYPAPDFLRKLYRDDRLNRKELKERLAAVRAVARGKLKPVLGSETKQRGMAA